MYKQGEEGAGTKEEELSFPVSSGEETAARHEGTATLSTTSQSEEQQTKKQTRSWEGQELEKKVSRNSKCEETYGAWPEFPVPSTGA